MNEEQVPETDIASLSHLVDAARGGDAAAHSEICRQVQGRLNRMADQHLNGQLRRKLNPSDIVQATMTRMVQGFGDFRGSTSAEFYGWLNAILKNEVHTTRRDYQRQCRDIRRETETRSAIYVSAPQHREDSPDAHVNRQEKLALFEDVIQRLSPDHAQVIELRSIKELSFEEVAKRMDRTVNAVSKLWSRALVGLQKELAKANETRANNAINRD